MGGEGEWWWGSVGTEWRWVYDRFFFYRFASCRDVIVFVLVDQPDGIPEWFSEL